MRNALHPETPAPQRVIHDIDDYSNYHGGAPPAERPCGGLNGVLGTGIFQISGFAMWLAGWSFSTPPVGESMKFRICQTTTSTGDVVASLATHLAVLQDCNFAERLQFGQSATLNMP
jgi:hypothetical protein